MNERSSKGFGQPFDGFRNVLDNATWRILSLVDVEWDVSGFGVGHVLATRQVESHIEEVHGFFSRPRL